VLAALAAPLRAFVWGGSAEVRIRLARVFGKAGRLNNHRTPSGAVVMTNDAATDGERGPPRPTRSSLCGHKPQKGKRMEIHPAGDPSAAGRGAAPGPPFSRYAGCCPVPWEVERVGPGAEPARDLAQMLPNKRAGTRATTLSPGAGPDRATANPPPKSGGPRAPGGGVGRVMPPSRRASRPTPS
jgi:hypothetical protein